jgi:hypothetical protein
MSLAGTMIMTTVISGDLAETSWRAAEAAEALAWAGSLGPRIYNFWS